MISSIINLELLYVQYNGFSFKFIFNNLLTDFLSDDINILNIRVF